MKVDLNKLINGIKIKIKSISKKWLLGFLMIAIVTIVFVWFVSLQKIDKDFAFQATVNFKNKEQKINKDLEIGKEVVYYGKLLGYWRTGVFYFHYYDIKKNQLEQPDNFDHYFSASTPGNGWPESKPYIDLVDKNEDAIFKVTGIRTEDDSGIIHTIDIEKIEVYKK